MKRKYKSCKTRMASPWWGQVPLLEDRSSPWQGPVPLGGDRYEYKYIRKLKTQCMTMRYTTG